MVLAAIGLGSNVGEPAKNIQLAIEEIALLGKTIAVSSLYHSSAWGYTEQADFFNAAMIIDVSMSAPDLLVRLQDIESRMGRTPTFKWGPRLIDLDLLVFGNETIDSPSLVLPHPFMFERAFVLKPLAEIAPEYAEPLNRLPKDIVDGVQVIPQNELN